MINLRKKKEWKQKIIENNPKDIINILLKKQGEEEERKEKEKKEEEKKEENKKEKEKKEELKKEEDNKKEEYKKNETNRKNLKNLYLSPSITLSDILDEDLAGKIDLDEEIKKAIYDQMKSLEDIIIKINKRNNRNPNDRKDNNEEEDSQNDENNKNSENSNSNSNLNKVSNKIEKTNVENELIGSSIDKIPLRFQNAYFQVKSLIIEYMNNYNSVFYQEVFDQFALRLKELYEFKFQKCTEIINEYINKIRENEYLLENDENLSEERKLEIQQIIDSLNEEKNDEIEKFKDEFNREIMDTISELKLNLFKNNSSIQLLEERVKLEIYYILNNSFY